MACGRADLSFRWSLAWLLLLPPVVWVGSTFGVTGLAAALALLGFVGWLAPAWYFIVRPLAGISLTEYLGVLLLPLLLALAAGAAGHAVALLATGTVPRLLLGATAGALAYLALSWRFNAEWFQAMREIAGLARRA